MLDCFRIAVINKLLGSEDGDYLGTPMRNRIA